MLKYINVSQCWFDEMLPSAINMTNARILILYFQGTYPIKPTLPGVGGGEGVAEVLETKGSKLEPGDWVLPGLAMSGTWRTHGVYEEENLIKIRNDISVESAATLMINPATALRMLEDFISLRAGDWIVQNGANSAVGLAVIEIAKVQIRMSEINKIV